MRLSHLASNVGFLVWFNGKKNPVFSFLADARPRAKLRSRLEKVLGSLDEFELFDIVE